MNSLARCLATIALSLGVFSVLAPSAMASSGTIVMGSPLFSGGTITYNPITKQLTGTDITIGAVGGIGTPLHSGPPGNLVTGTCGLGVGCLDFTTGALSSHVGNIWTFGGAGTQGLSVTGATSAGPASGTLLQLLGSFTTAQVSFEQGGLLSLILQGPDQKNAALVNYFFGSAAPPAFNFTSTFNADNGPNSEGIGNAFTFDVTSAEVDNVAASAIPEPSSVILLLTAVGATGFLYRARSRRSKKIAS
jgi:hypothetical protein